MSNSTALQAVLRQDALSFIRKVIYTLTNTPVEQQPDYLVLCAAYVQLIADKKLRRLIVNAPPRVFKSMVFSRSLIAWMVGRNPKLKVILITHSRELSAEFMRNVRSIVESDWYKAAFPAMRLSPNKNTEHEMETTAGGSILATSSESGVTGRGADILIFDDYNGAHEIRSPDVMDAKFKAFREKYMTRLNDQTTGIVIIVAQRLSDGDLSGRVLEIGGFEHLMVPLVAEEDQVFEVAGRIVYRRAAGHILDKRIVPDGDPRKLIRDLGQSTYLAQYQQTPTANADAILRPEWLPQVEVNWKGQIVLSIDTATSLGEQASFSVIEVWLVDGEVTTLIEVVRGRFDYSTIVSHVEAAIVRHQPSKVLVEEMNIGSALISDINRKKPGLAVACKPTVSKEARLERNLDRFHRGFVRVKAGEVWTERFLQEVLSFPNGRYSDQTDAMTQLLDWLQSSPPLIKRELGIIGSSQNSPRFMGRLLPRTEPHPMRDPKARHINLNL